MQGTIERGVYGTSTIILDLQDGYKGVIYQDTCVAKWKNDHIVLTAPDASKTQTTKLRMNQASFQFNLGYYVMKQRGKWFVCTSQIINGKLKPHTKMFEFTGYKIVLNRIENGTFVVPLSDLFNSLG